MLILSRKTNERVVIGHDIAVTIIEIRGDKVRLGITAPRDTSVHRQEVYEAINGVRYPRLALDQPVTHDGGPDRCDGAPSDGVVG